MAIRKCDVLFDLGSGAAQPIIPAITIITPPYIPPHTNPSRPRKLARIALDCINENTTPPATKPATVIRPRKFGMTVNVSIGTKMATAIAIAKPDRPGRTSSRFSKATELDSDVWVSGFREGT